MAFSPAACYTVRTGFCQTGFFRTEVKNMQEITAKTAKLYNGLLDS